MTSSTGEQAMRMCRGCGAAFPATPEFFDRHSARYLSPKCKPCARERSRAKREAIKNDPERLAKRREYDAAKKREYRQAGTEYAERQRGLCREYYHKNAADEAWFVAERERKKALARAKWARDPQHRTAEMDRTRGWRLKNPDRARELERASQGRKRARAEIDPEYRELALVWHRKSYRRLVSTPEGRGRHRAKAERYSSRQKTATPPWADLAAIDAVYAEAARLTADTGVPHEVDHIVPIQSDVVCGLHVPANLRVVPRFDNRSKGNRLLIDVLEQAA